MLSSSCVPTGRADNPAIDTVEPNAATSHQQQETAPISQIARPCEGVVREDMRAGGPRTTRGSSQAYRQVELVVDQMCGLTKFFVDQVCRRAELVDQVYR
ncbi:hypothetical protein NP493_2300g00012 [Ridgeia piscesae]|uniref:Uncharacterized protein n=1 Tax=Ridgeia piscesae TaxID=27915 RepID=A0AAD9N2Y4_RIDPI|nr:hypothetical protein NP493_2300g00012 [Ridgeia piscesae]